VFLLSFWCPSLSCCSIFASCNLAAPSVIMLRIFSSLILINRIRYLLLLECYRSFPSLILPITHPPPQR
jgi:hypothetical protein